MQYSHDKTETKSNPLILKFISNFEEPHLITEKIKNNETFAIK